MCWRSALHLQVRRQGGGSGGESQLTVLGPVEDDVATHAEEEGGQGPQEDDHRGMLPSPPRAPVTGGGNHAAFARTDVDHPTLP